MKTVVDIEKIMELVLEEAFKRAEDSGYGGSSGDGGASALRVQVEFYRCGMKGEIPTEWREYVKKIKKISDPEYAEYLRLKEKFKNNYE